MSSDLTHADAPLASHGQAAPQSEQPPSTAEREERFQKEVWSNLGRNYFAHLVHGMLGQTGFRLLQAPTFLPTYIALISGSVQWVGVVRGLQGLGQCITPFLSATLVEQRRRVLPLGFAIGGLMRLQLLGVALAGFFLPDFWNLIALSIFMTLFGFFLGMQGVVFNTLMSKVIPVERRGRLTGLRNALAGGVVFLVGGYGGTYLIEPNLFGNGYAATFLVAFLLTAAGLAMLSLTREPEAPTVRAAARVRDRIRDIPAMLRSDPDFARYFIARAVATIGRMALPFYILFAREQASIPITGTELGILTGAFTLAQSSPNVVWGVLADRAGFRVVFLISMAIWIGSAGVLLIEPATVLGVVAETAVGAGFDAALVESMSAALELTLLVAIYVGIGAGLGGFMMASMNMVLEFGDREDVPLRIALANSASEMLGGVATVSAGFLVAIFGYQALILLAIGFKALALPLMWSVREPRFRE